MAFEPEVVIEMRRVRNLLVATTLALGLFAAAAHAVTISFNAVHEPLSGTQQKFTASWTNAGWAQIMYDDRGLWGPYWGTDDGSKTNYHTYPCVDGNVSRDPALFTGAGFVDDPFTQLDSTPGRCPTESGTG